MTPSELVPAPAAQPQPAAPQPARGALPRTTHRLLVMRGLDPVQAANLTAFLNGLPVDRHTWSLREINRLLFLRDIAHRVGWEH